MKFLEIFSTAVDRSFQKLKSAFLTKIKNSQNFLDPNNIMTAMPSIVEGITALPEHQFHFNIQHYKFTLHLFVPGHSLCRLAKEK